jgi:CheY-like chemotaxis protein
LRNTATISFSVIDTGVGIDPSQREHIFDTFTQADSATTRKYGGTGLGLSICRKLLRMVKSDLTMVSEPGKGSRFSFVLNFIVSDSTDTQKKNKEKDYSILKNKTVLVTEDNQVNVYVLKQFLKKWEMQVDVAENGEMALNMIQSKDYDMVLMDIHMPIMDGIEATRIIRNTLKKRMPIIALTAGVDEDITLRMADYGMDDCVVKPFDPEELSERMIQLIT